jgi:hypothetical protein
VSRFCSGGVLWHGKRVKLIANRRTAAQPRKRPSVAVLGAGRWLLGRAGPSPDAIGHRGAGRLGDAGPGRLPAAAAELQGLDRRLPGGLPHLQHRPLHGLLGAELRDRAGEIRTAFEQSLFSALFSAIRSVCTVVIYPPEQDGKLTRANNDIRDAAVARVKLISNAVQASLTGLPESRDLAQLF